MFFIHQKRNPIQLVIQFHLSSIQMMIHPCTLKVVSPILNIWPYNNISPIQDHLFSDAEPHPYLTFGPTTIFLPFKITCLVMLSLTHTQHLALQQYFSHLRFTCLVMLSLTTHKHELETIKRSETTETHHVSWQLGDRKLTIRWWCEFDKIVEMDVDLKERQQQLCNLARLTFAKYLKVKEELWKILKNISPCKNYNLQKKKIL